MKHVVYEMPTIQHKKCLYGLNVGQKKIGVSLSLTSGDIFIPKVCPVLGIPLFVGKGKQGPNSPSLDRIDSKLGYMSDNVMVISYKANAMKQNASKEELLLFADWVYQNV